MTYNLFLDDERRPGFLLACKALCNIPREYSDEAIAGKWVVARDFDSAVSIVEQFGLPGITSFDNDLGGVLEGIDFAKWLTEFAAEDKSLVAYLVHSMNPIVAGRIADWIDDYNTYLINTLASEKN